MTKLISWNVNGLRACVGKGFLDFFREAEADVFCIQESKLQEGQIELDLPGYHQYWNYARKKGYSGTAMFTKEEPVSVSYGIGMEEHDTEGRVITAEFPEYYVVTCYTPNSQDGLARLDYRMKWEDDFLAYLKKLEENKPVVFCGDLNVALPMRRGASSQTFWQQALWTRSAISIRTWRGLTPGGPTVSAPGPKMQGGALTIFVYQKALRTDW